jgi:hypothetical protein
LNYHKHEPKRFSDVSRLPSNGQNHIGEIMGRFPWQIVTAVHAAMLATSSEHHGVVLSLAGLVRILPTIEGTPILGLSARRSCILKTPDLPDQVGASRRIGEAEKKRARANTECVSKILVLKLSGDPE